MAVELLVAGNVGNRLTGVTAAQQVAVAGDLRLVNWLGQVGIEFGAVLAQHMAQQRLGLQPRRITSNRP